MSLSTIKDQRVLCLIRAKSVNAFTIEYVIMKKAKTFNGGYKEAR